MIPADARPRRFIDTRTMELVEFGEDATVPPYAILSHRWIIGEEIVYEEYLQCRDETLAKSGYQKIQAACRQARQDSLRYLWVDTCCVKQGNHEDVARNVKSMFMYYQNAEICYAYLVDVDLSAKVGKYEQFWWISSCIPYMVVHYGTGIKVNPFKQSDWRIWSMFRRSEWSRRGWTLQELVAPGEVVFFDQSWARIGTKYDLCHETSLVTGIPFQVLTGHKPLRDVHVLDRIPWALGRNTTRPQDQAYCLQGLLKVSLDPDYNENVRKSFKRLGEAFFAAHSMSSTGETSYSWIKPFVFWLVRYLISYIYSPLSLALFLVSPSPFFFPSSSLYFFYFFSSSSVSLSSALLLISTSTSSFFFFFVYTLSLFFVCFFSFSFLFSFL